MAVKRPIDETLSKLQALISDDLFFLQVNPKQYP